MKLGNLKVNSNLYDNGRWVDSKDIRWPDELADIRVHVRALDSREARRVRSERLMAMEEAQRRDLTPAQAYELNAAVLAHGVLVDWAGIDDDNGPIPFSAEAAEKLLADPDYRRLVDVVTTAAAIVQAEASTDMRAAAKN